jgi:hypothetical protein
MCKFCGTEKGMGGKIQRSGGGEEEWGGEEREN